MVIDTLLLYILNKNTTLWEEFCLNYIEVPRCQHEPQKRKIDNDETIISLYIIST